jgi:hypothetical protein
MLLVILNLILLEAGMYKLSKKILLGKKLLFEF